MNTGYEGNYIKPFTVPDGVLKGVVFRMFSFRPGFADIETMELEGEDPQFEFVHPDGRRQIDEPGELKAERERVAKARLSYLEKVAKTTKKPNPRQLAEFVVESKWEKVKRWGLLHDTFCVCFLLVDAIDFPDFNAATASEVRAFADFWLHKPESLLERWRQFRRIAGVNVINVLWDAYASTRDQAAAAAPELGQAIPPDNPLP